MRDHESTDLAGAAHFEFADSEPVPPPDPSEYLDLAYDFHYGNRSGILEPDNAFTDGA
jgi:hypothetical protein